MLMVVDACSNTAADVRFAGLCSSCHVRLGWFVGDVLINAAVL